MTHFASHDGSNNSFVRSAAARSRLVNCSNSQTSLRPEDLARTNVATFCHDLPESRNSTTPSHLYLCRSVEYNSFSKLGKFHRATAKKGVRSTGSGALGTWGYSRCRTRLSFVCHRISTTVDCTKSRQTISRTTRFHRRHVGLADVHSACRGNNLSILAHSSLGSSRDARKICISISGGFALILRRGGFCCARGTQQHKSDILQISHRLTGMNTRLHRSFKLRHRGRS